MTESGTQPGRAASAVGAGWKVWSLLAIAWFVTLGSHAVFDPDEGRYAEIPREMVASGDWITPRLNGLPYFEKPALQYWATAVAYEIGGISEATSRLWAFGLAFACLPLVAWLATGLGLSRGTGFRAAAFLAVSPFYVLVSHLNLLDQAFAFFLFAALATFTVAQRSEGRRRSVLGILCWLALAAAVLSKGIAALVLAGGTLVVHAVIHRDKDILRRLQLWPGLLLFFAVTVPWFLVVEQRNPGFAQFFFIHEHFQRFLTTVHDRDGPVYYFVPLLLLAVLPFIQTWRGPVAAWRAAPAGGAPMGAFPAMRFLLVWCGFTFVFFSVSHSKLPPYLLPILPPLFLVLAAAVQDDVRASRRAALIQVVVVTVFAVGLIVFDKHRDDASHLPVWWACAAALVSAVLGWLASRDRRADALAGPWLPVALAGLLAYQALLLAYAVLPPERSARNLVREIASEIRPTTRLYSVGQYRHSASFYLERGFVLVAFKGELEEGLRRMDGDPQLRYIPDLKSFIEVWRNEDDAVALINTKLWGELQAQGFEGRRLPSSDTRSVVVARR
ncbi:MAG: glycosyltransferase family 39 protein [Gammaproteobacteria bacterium]|nr:glycosyltransferase family 39 protein [Gammaproteobacteria bacterium]